ncbi:MAG: hypothetical protein ACI9A7_000999 [Cyclobacteriaceae bacterium]|jgi:hypothetical protein
MIKSKVNRNQEVYRILYPIDDTFMEDNTAWVGELCIRTGFQLALLDFTDPRKGDIDTLVKKITQTLSNGSFSVNDLAVINKSNLTENIRDDEDIAIISEGIMQAYQTHTSPHVLPLIILPENHCFSKWNNQNRVDTTTEKFRHFFQILKQAQKQRLPQQIFQVLANDNHLFNEFLEKFREK